MLLYFGCFIPNFASHHHTRCLGGRNGMPSVRRASLSFIYQNPLCAFLPFIVAMDLNLFRTPGAKYRILLLLLACVCCLYVLGPLVPILFDVARNTKEARKLNYDAARIEKPVMPPPPPMQEAVYVLVGAPPMPLCACAQ